MAKNDSNWADERLTALDSADGWHPDPNRGMARLRDHRRLARRHRIEWMAATVAGMAACVVAVVLLSPGACAMPHGCTGDNTVRPGMASNFKESGSPAAPIVCEVYTDYECPTCAALYRDTMPAFVEQYVRTGKVRLLHRDFPLSQHGFARLAARWVNAAGSIGRYDHAVGQIFGSQNVWGLDGNLDAQLSQVLSPEEMTKVRDLVANDPHLDDSVAADTKMGAADGINRTPTIVVVSGGKRQVLAGVPQFATLQAYLDSLLPPR